MLDRFPVTLLAQSWLGLVAQAFASDEGPADDGLCRGLYCG